MDSKKSKVTCKPDSKGKFGTVSQTFDIRDKSVEVVHEVKKGKDKITFAGTLDYRLNRIKTVIFPFAGKGPCTKGGQVDPY